MGEYTNNCVIKFFDISRELILNVANEYVDEYLHIDIEEKYKDIKVTITNTDTSDVAFCALLRRLAEEFESFMYADRDISLEQCLVETLAEKGAFISVAESLTGGMVASRICNISGASRVFYEGMVTYNPASKVRRLHVPLHMIEEKGTVNAEVARAMALGLLANKEIRYALSTTGVAGPLSDDYGNPVGKVFVAYGDKNYVEVKELNLSGDREEIRQTTVNYALFFMLRFINKYN